MRLIDADELIAEMKEYRTEQEKEQMYSGDRGICVTWNDAVFFIKNAPTIEPERKRGEWKDRGEDYMIRWICSECGRKETHVYNFCPDCGADMRDSE